MMANSLELTAPTSPEARERDAVWFRNTLVVVGCLLVLRLIFLAIAPLDLVHDEAYYWDWSRQLDWGYYSKPPMVAWLIALSTKLLGPTAFAVRLPAVLLGTGGLLIIYAFAARLYDARAGFWSVLLVAATPAGAALSLLMTIDAPLMFCWTAALYALWRFLETPTQRGRWFVATVLAIGVGLLSKQTMLAFIPLTGLFLLASPPDRRHLRRWEVWLCPIVALLFLTPVLWWNTQHGWITLEHTSSHFASEPVPWLKRITRCLELVGSLVGVASPITFWLMLSIGAAGLLRFTRLDRRERFLVCFSGIPLCGVLLLSLKQRLEPNWPAPFFITGVVLVVGTLLNHCPVLAARGDGEKKLRRAIAVGAVFTLATYLVAWGVGLQGTKLDPAVRLRGWRELGERVSTQWAEVPRPEQTLLISTSGRATASELAFYLPTHPQAYVYNGSGMVGSQYDVWGGPRDKQGWDAVIIAHEGEPIPADLRAAFASVEAKDVAEVTIGNRRCHRYRVWHARGFQHWPDDAHFARRVDVIQRR
jgi:4-amino-4-deoxy-L-arabinose transferase-like glycosyltransferase